MNLSGFVGNQSDERLDVNHTGQRELDRHMNRIKTMQSIIFYIAAVLGIPGNILSAIVWLRRRVSSKNSSAIYLAVIRYLPGSTGHQ